MTCLGELSLIIPALLNVTPYLLYCRILPAKSTHIDATEDYETLFIIDYPTLEIKRKKGLTLPAKEE